MMLAELMDRLQLDREFVIKALTPQDFDLKKTLKQNKNEHDVEKCVLKSIDRGLLPEFRLWEPKGENANDNTGKAFEHIYIQSFEKEIAHARVHFEHLGDGVWNVTMTRGGFSWNEERSLPALNDVLAEAHYLGKCIFECRPLEGDEWREL